MNSFFPDEELQKNYYGKDLAAKSAWYSQVALAYNQVRPRYSDRLIDSAIKYAQLPDRAAILEIGCGPGIATVSLARRGFRVLGLEPSLAACEIARNSCVDYPDVEICQTTLEEWSVKPQRFDAVLAATSLHWVSPKIGYPKIAQALKPSGSLILLWNAGLRPDAAIYQLLEPIYQQFAPTLKPVIPQNEEQLALEAIGQTVSNSGYFQQIASQQLTIAVNYSLTDYLLLLSTYSPYIALETAQRQRLFTAITESLQKISHDSLSLSYLSLLQVFKLRQGAKD